MSGTSVREVMTQAVVAVRPEDSFKEAYRRMQHAHVSGLPVVDENGRVVGVVTEADLLRLWELRTRGSVTVRDVMSSDPIVVDEDAPVQEAARVLSTANVRRLTVVDGDGRLVGIVSRRDLLEPFGKRDQQLAEELTAAVLRGALANHAKDVGLSVRDGVVHVHGWVYSAATKSRLTAMILAVDGVVGVENHVRVA